MGGITEAHFRKSKRLGAAARICNLIKGQDVISEYEILLAAGGEIGISADTMDNALRELEEIGYVTIHRSSGDIAKLEERIPLLDRQYAEIGEKWIASGPSEIESAALDVIDDLMMAPQRERDLTRKHNLDRKTFSIIADVGKAGAFYKRYQSPVDGSEIAYSPLYHDENPEVLIRLFDRFPTEDVSQKLRSIRAYQGTPVDDIVDPVLREAIRMGCVPTPSVNSSSGTKHFAFTPLQGVGKLEKSLLEKARAVVSCVRYGQHFASITKIEDPLVILLVLKDRKRIGPHSEILKQYSLLHKLGIGRITHDPRWSTRFNFELIDTPENNRAMELAVQYLTIREVVKADANVNEARQLFLPGMYGSPTKTRIELKTVVSTELSDDGINHLNHLIIGGASGF